MTVKARKKAISKAYASRDAAGTGLDFSAASVVVFVELPAEVALVQQAEDRAHRHGQTLPVNVYFLLARGTTDERRQGPGFLRILTCLLILSLFCVLLAALSFMNSCDVQARVIAPAAVSFGCTSFICCA